MKSERVNSGGLKSCGSGMPGCCQARSACSLSDNDISHVVHVEACE